MTETPSHPSRLLRLFAGFARWSLWLLLAFWLLVAVAWGLLHGFIVPRIGDFRLQVQTQAEKALGVPVRIGGLSARSDDLIPTLELTDVQLLDPSGREALRLPQVVAAISPRSLLHLGFEQLYLNSPELDVRRDAEGQIHVAGLPIQGSGGGGDHSAADWVFSQAEVAILHGKLRWTDELRGAPPLELSDVNLVLRNGSWRHGVRLESFQEHADHVLCTLSDVATGKTHKVSARYVVGCDGPASTVRKGRLRRKLLSVFCCSGSVLSTTGKGCAGSLASASVS